MRSLPAAAVAFSLLIAAACSGTDAASPSDPSQADAFGADGGKKVFKTAADGPSGIPCDVDAILAANCRKCHSDPPQYGAPMPLLTWDNLHAAAPSDASKHVYEMAAQKIADDAEPMPPPPNARLSASDRSVVTAWAAAGAPKSTATCGTTTTPVDPTTGLSCPITRTLAATSAYAMPKDVGDQYVCWGIDVTADTPTHIVGFAPRIDNTTIVHHVVMYESSQSYTSTPTPCDAGAALAWRMVLGWAPGVKGIELPKEAGFPIKPGAGTHYVVQMHYSNVQHLDGQRDASKIDVCTEPPRQYEADVVAFGTQDIHIPEAPPAGGVFTRNCKVEVPSQLAGSHLFTAMPHMHKLGVSMATTLERGGQTFDLGTMPSYDFNRQAWLPIADVVTQAGDVIRTKCGYTNTTGHKVDFGEKTADEMCYSFTMYYPRIDLGSWALPALESDCVSEP